MLKVKNKDENILSELEDEVEKLAADERELKRKFSDIKKEMLKIEDDLIFCKIRKENIEVKIKSIKENLLK